MKQKITKNLALILCSLLIIPLISSPSCKVIAESTDEIYEYTEEDIDDLDEYCEDDYEFEEDADADVDAEDEDIEIEDEEYCEEDIDETESFDEDETEGCIEYYECYVEIIETEHFSDSIDYQNIEENDVTELVSIDEIIETPSEPSNDTQENIESETNIETDINENINLETELVETNDIIEE